LLDEAREPVQVELALGDLDEVAGRPGHDRNVGLLLATELASQSRDAGVHGVDGCLRRLVPEELVDQPLGRNDTIRMQEQVGEKGLLPRADDGDLGPFS
jgi:hypothetical protein